MAAFFFGTGLVVFSTFLTIFSISLSFSAYSDSSPALAIFSTFSAVSLDGLEVSSPYEFGSLASSSSTAFSVSSYFSLETPSPPVADPAVLTTFLAFNSSFATFSASALASAEFGRGLGSTDLAAFFTFSFSFSGSASSPVLGSVGFSVASSGAGSLSSACSSSVFSSEGYSSGSPLESSSSSFGATSAFFTGTVSFFAG